MQEKNNAPAALWSPSATSWSSREQGFQANLREPTRRTSKFYQPEGASISRMLSEEHNSQGNCSWLFSGSNQNVGFFDQVPSAANHPDYPFTAAAWASG